MDDFRAWLAERFPALVIMVLLVVGVALIGRGERRG